MVGMRRMFVPLQNKRPNLPHSSSGKASEQLKCPLKKAQTMNKYRERDFITSHHYLEIIHLKASGGYRQVVPKDLNAEAFLFENKNTLDLFQCHC